VSKQFLFTDAATLAGFFLVIPGSALKNQTFVGVAQMVSLITIESDRPNEWLWAQD
jgi:hypothetical protein